MNAVIPYDPVKYVINYSDSKWPSPGLNQLY